MSYSRRRPRFARVCRDCGSDGIDDYGYACSACDGSGYLRRCRRCHVNDAPVAYRTEEELRRYGGLCRDCATEKMLTLPDYQPHVFAGQRVIHAGTGETCFVNDDGECC